MMVLAAACVCPGGGNLLHRGQSSLRPVGFVSPASLSLQVRRAACERQHQRGPATVLPARCGAARMLSAGPTGEEVPPAQIATLSEQDVEGELQNKSEPDTFRERFGDAIPDWLLDRLATSGFTVPTAVQV